MDNTDKLSIAAQNLNERNDGLDVGDVLNRLCADLALDIETFKDGFESKALAMTEDYIDFIARLALEHKIKPKAVMAVTAAFNVGAGAGLIEGFLLGVELARVVNANQAGMN